MQGKFRVILRNEFEIITAMIVQNAIFTTNFFQMDSFNGWTFPLGEEGKKNLLNLVAGNRAEQIQSYLLNLVRHYHYDDSAKYHFQNQVISNQCWMGGGQIHSFVL